MKLRSKLASAVLATLSMSLLLGVLPAPALFAAEENTTAESKAEVKMVEVQNIELGPPWLPKAGQSFSDYRVSMQPFVLKDGAATWIYDMQYYLLEDGKLVDHTKDGKFVSGKPYYIEMKVYSKDGDMDFSKTAFTFEELHDLGKVADDKVLADPAACKPRDYRYSLDARKGLHLLYVIPALEVEKVRLRIAVPAIYTDITWFDLWKTQVPADFVLAPDALQVWHRDAGQKEMSSVPATDHPSQGGVYRFGMKLALAAPADTRVEFDHLSINDTKAKLAPKDYNPETADDTPVYRLEDEKKGIFTLYFSVDVPDLKDVRMADMKLLLPGKEKKEEAAVSKEETKPATTETVTSKMKDIADSPTYVLGLVLFLVIAMALLLLYWRWKNKRDEERRSRK